MSRPSAGLATLLLLKEKIGRGWMFGPCQARQVPVALEREGVPPQPGLEQVYWYDISTQQGRKRTPGPADTHKTPRTSGMGQPSISLVEEHFIFNFHTAYF